MLFPSRSMAATDGQVVVAAARWSDEGSYLKEFATKHRLPAVVKIIKGQYGGLGVPTLPSPGLQSTALLISAGRRRKIVAQAVKLKEGRRLVCVGPRLAIPDSYAGYFELLSEEGRAVRCMESVSELSRRRIEDGCLVREPMRAIIGRIESNGTISADGARNLQAGETIIPEGEIQIGGSKGKYLKCIDSKGDTILLSLDQRGKFSPLAREDNISGVHTAKNLLSKRMPLTVRLVFGTPPRGLKSAGHFVPELRLLTSFEEEHIFALPLQKDSNALVALPLAAPLKLQKCRNDEQIKNFMEFSRLVEKSSRLIGDVADRIQVLDGKLGDPKKFLSTSSNHIAKTGYFLRRSASSDSAARKYINNTHPPEKSLTHTPIPPEEYDEIDQIYDYVRGFAPLPKSVKNQFETPVIDTKPEPPPIETIPTKKLPIKSAEKRTRKPTAKEPTPVIVYKEKPTTPIPTNLPKLYLKNNNSSQRSRLFRQKSNSPVLETQPSPLASPGLKSDSPLFNIRYKSLSNLQQAMEMDGTLDSSNSGGRTSNESAAAKLPEKRSRRLSRPKSLTNLVWELRGCAPEPAYEKPKSRSKNEAPFHRKCANKLSLSAQKRVPTLYL